MIDKKHSSSREALRHSSTIRNMARLASMAIRIRFPTLETNILSRRIDLNSNLRSEGIHSKLIYRQYLVSLLQLK